MVAGLSRSERFGSLDGLRAIAMLSVFAYHFALPAGPLLAWGNMGFRVIPHLDLGVEIFFVLSGFLIFRPFCAANLGPGAGPELRGYALRRCVRIFLAYWLALGVLTAIGDAHVDGGADAFLTHLLLVHTYVSPGAGGIAQSWTLVVELSFYAFVPILALALRRTSIAGHVAVLGALTLLGVAMRWYTFNHHVARGLDVLPPALAALGPGMLLAVVSVVGEQRPGVAVRATSLGRRAWVWWLAAAGLFALLMRYAPTNAVYSVRIGDSSAELWHRMLAPAVAALLVAPAVLAPRSPGMIRRALSARPIVWIGVVSYGAYLWHGGVLTRGVSQDFLNRHGPLFDLGVGLCALAVTLLIAAASWYLLERPALRHVNGFARHAFARSDPSEPTPLPSHVDEGPLQANAVARIRGTTQRTVDEEQHRGARDRADDARRSDDGIGEAPAEQRPAEESRHE